MIFRNRHIHQIKSWKIVFQYSNRLHNGMNFQILQIYFKVWCKWKIFNFDKKVYFNNFHFSSRKLYAYYITNLFLPYRISVILDIIVLQFNRKVKHSEETSIRDKMYFKGSAPKYILEMGEKKKDTSKCKEDIRKYSKDSYIYK